MKNLKVLSIILISFVWMACGSANDETSELTKDEVRMSGKADENEDWCESFNWYGDGVCDDFCSKPDPDCGATCAAVPTCEGNDLEVNNETCLAAGSSCFTVELCGSTVECLEVSDFCPQVVGTSPVCPIDSSPVDKCQNVTNCSIETGEGDKCDEVVFCEPSFTCLAIPSCQLGELEVSDDDCAAAGDSCENVALCSQDINCWDFPKVCPQVVGTPASCDANQIEVTNCQTEELNDGTCELRNGTGDQCASFIYCAS